MQVLTTARVGGAGTLIATDDLPLHASAHHGARPTLSSPQAAVAAACASLEKRLHAEMSAQASCNLGAPT